MYNEFKIMFLLNNSLVKTEYLMILLFLLFSIVLSLFILAASYFFAKQNPELEKLSAYECGFEPHEDTRHTFDVKFCVVAILFLLFDLEIMFLVPWSITIAKLNLLSF